MVAGEDTSLRTLKGKYRLLRKLGQGGMGAVYLSHHELLDQSVAVKVMAPSLLESPTALERFLREARALASVHHPGLCRIFDVDTTDEGLPFIVMEFIDGLTLDAVLRDRPATAIAERVRWIVEASDALAVAHDQHIVHRDVKPANIMLTHTGAIRVVDFGVARRREDDARMLTGDALIGTLNYLAPEQIQGEPVDHRSDVWAMAVTLYRLLSGQFPFEGDSLTRYLAAVVEGAPRTLEQRGVAVPQGLWSVLARALRPRATRTPGLREFAEALRPFAVVDASTARTAPDFAATALEPAPIASPRRNTLRSGGRETAVTIDEARRRSRAPMVAAALGVVAVIALGGLLLSGRQPVASGEPAPLVVSPTPGGAEPPLVSGPLSPSPTPAPPAPLALEPEVEPVHPTAPALQPVPPTKPPRPLPKTRPRPVDKNPDHL
jgi:serine/threonine protein kinase